MPEIVNPNVATYEDNVVVFGSYTTIDGIYSHATALTYDSGCNNVGVGWRTGVRLYRGPSQHNTVKNSKFSHHSIAVLIDSDSAGTTHSDYNTIVNNIFDHNDIMQTLTPTSVNANDDTGSVAIGVHGDYNNIYNNTFSSNYGCSYDYGIDGGALDVFGGVGNIMHHNKSTNDTDFVELGGHSRKSSNNAVYYNLYSTNLNIGGFLVTRGALDTNWGPVYNTTAYNNTAYLPVYKSSVNGVVCQDGCNSGILQMKNNIIWTDRAALYTDAKVTDIEANNIYWANDGAPFIGGDTAQPISSTSKIINPLFMNPGTDFHLQSASFGIDHGNSKSVSLGYTLDLDNDLVPAGLYPDIGAYEYGALPQASIAPIQTQAPSPTATAAPKPTATATAVPLPTATATAVPVPTATAQPVVNLLNNPSFETTGSNWLSPWAVNYHGNGSGNIYQVNATKVDGAYSAQIDIYTQTTDYYDQLLQPNLALVSGKTYTLTFWAKANFNRPIRVGFQQSNSPYTSYLSQTVNITTNWAEYTLTFTPSKIVDNNTMLEFNLAAYTGHVWLDNLSLTSN